MTSTLIPALPDRQVRPLAHWIGGDWLHPEPGVELDSAILRQQIAQLPGKPAPCQEALAFGRSIGRDELLKGDFQSRALRLRALAKFLLEHKAVLYAWSFHTGATKKDSWIDIEGGIATLSAYAALAQSELASGNLLHEGPSLSLGKQGQWMGSHILVPREGIAVHINAFNFPVWGVLEKFAPCFIAGMPCLFKPASATAYLSEVLVRLIDASGLLPKGSLQLMLGSSGDLLEHMLEGDVLTFTGSAHTARTLRTHPNIVHRSIPVNTEADSLNAALLGPDIQPGDPEWDLMVKEIVQEMTIKAGQKCTAIRRILVPHDRIDVMAEAIAEKLSRCQIGDTRLEAVNMGALASAAQGRDVQATVKQLLTATELFVDPEKAARPLGENLHSECMVAPSLLYCARPDHAEVVHSIEAFGPVSTIMPYRDFEHGLTLATRAKGSLVASLFTHDTGIAQDAVLKLAAWHGRLAVIDRDAASESTGHGSPLPALKHGGPGRAGGGEELGGIRAVKHYLQRAAVQGSPRMLSAITTEYQRGAPVIESELHPFKRHFEDLAIGHSLLTHRRTVTEADLVLFGGLSGDYFYMHFDDEAAKASVFGKRIAHGYFVLSAAAGLFVHPSPGPVLANYGIDSLRFVKPVGIGDTIRARLTCKRKIDKPSRKAGEAGQGVVAWDVAVTNQAGDLVASYDILTLVQKRAPDPAELR